MANELIDKLAAASGRAVQEAQIVWFKQYHRVLIAWAETIHRFAIDSKLFAPRDTLAIKLHRSNRIVRQCYINPPPGFTALQHIAIGTFER